MASSEKNQELIKAARTLSNVPWCEDYERMISGMFYNCLVPQLNEARFHARRFAMKYNTYFPEDATSTSLTAEREVMLQQVMGRLGEGAFIEPPFFIDYGCNTSIGSHFYANFNTVILDWWTDYDPAWCHNWKGLYYRCW